MVADGAAAETLSKWVGQFFKGVQSESQSGQKLNSEASQYHGGEHRTGHPGGNAIAIAFPGSAYTNPKPEIAVLAALLGGQSTIKWAPGYSLLSKATSGLSGLSVSASNLAYSDAGLLTIQLAGPAASVREGAAAAVKAVENIANGSVSKEDISKAIANAKFNALDATQLREPTLHLVGSGLVNTGKAFESASLVQGIENVTADKLKTVREHLRPLMSGFETNHFLPLGRQIATGWQGFSGHCGGSLPAALRLADWSPGVVGVESKDEITCTNSQSRLELRYPYQGPCLSINVEEFLCVQRGSTYCTSALSLYLSRPTRH